ncbi:MAG TPA: phosphate starvation-inducible protein PhoH [Eubacteriaceae bacterium]|nr:phosphate starvation-inducible protein PhoH [Eubacteriaceae bacterium]
MEKTIEMQDTDVLARLFGNLDQNIKKIENGLKVKVVSRNDEVKIIGETQNVKNAQTVIEKLIDFIQKGIEIDWQNIDYFIDTTLKDQEEKQQGLDQVLCYTARGKSIRPKTQGQKKYLDAIKNNEIVFGIGPAGTGKTYLAMAMAVKAFKREEVQRIILTRPAVEAGESLGFLPGDLQEKVDPYLRPLYDALHDILGPEAYLKYKEKGLIEIAPLAYMRGRTLDDSFIILDEAQNTTPQQMKMFLTRLGFGSKVVVTGDVTQIDLPGGRSSGLKEVETILNKIQGIEFVYLTKKDVVRHQLVQRIIEAYEENNQ